MKKRYILSVGLVVIAAILAGGLAYAYGDVTVKVNCKGSFKGYSASYPFNINGDSKVSGDVLAKGGEKALQAIFKGLTVGGDNKKVEEVTGDLKIKDGKVSGKVKLHWTVNNNPKNVECDIEGTASGEGSITSISFKGKNYNVNGTWNWGGGVFNMTGEATLEVSSKE